ncbi:MAG: hypothetical protein OXO54_04800 [Chloroflexota bacterium]|nr:hypothetical protein [Chloroflexota bacterium]MDE2897623.1 hypothetical protein [Chloroflexota bacterium]
MAFHALQAALAAMGIERSLDSLVTRSGEAFWVPWSETADAETMRYTRMMSTLFRATDLAKVRIEIGGEDDAGSAIAALRQHTSAGRLVIAPVFSKGRFGVIQSVDANGVARAVGPDQLEPGSIDLSGGWSGALPAYPPRKWIYGAIRRDRPIKPAGIPVPDLAGILFVPLGDDIEIRGVCFGIEAVRGATEAVRAGAPLRDHAALERLLVTFEQAEFGFGCAERWLASKEAAHLWDAAELARLARSLRAASGELAERLWDSAGTDSALALGRAVKGRKSAVFELPADLDREPPGRVVELLRGRAVIVDTRSRRAALSRLADVVERAALAFAREVDSVGALSR